MKRKFYNYVPEDKRHLLSLNYLLADKIIVNWKAMDIRGMSVKESSWRYNNNDFFCMICNKHITRYVENAYKLKIIKI